MIIKKLVFLPKILFLIFLASACNAPGLTPPKIIKTEMGKLKQNYETGILKSQLIIFSEKGAATPASISLNLNFKAKGFNIQAKTIANDLKSLKFCLLESNTGVSPSGGTNLSPFGEVFTYNITAHPATITFTNLPANNTGKSYYIAVAAYDELNGNGNNITSNTGNNAENNRVTISEIPGNFYVSNGGGDTSGTNAGSVRVTPVTYTVSSPDSLTVNLKLLD